MIPRRRGDIGRIDRTAETRPVIWARPERAAKGPAPSLSRAQIATAAIALADVEGIDAVSMRRLAGELGVAATSLYGYVERKDELYDLMIDAVEGEDGGLPEPTDDWRIALRVFAYRLHTLIHRHPWIATLAPGRPTMGPNSLARAERILTALNRLGLDIDAMMAIVETIDAYVRGNAISQLAEHEARRRSGLDTQQWMQARGPYVQTIIDTGDYPMLTRVIRDAAQPHDRDSAEHGFRTGLELILNGIATHLRSRDSSDGPAPKSETR